MAASLRAFVDLTQEIVFRNRAKASWWICVAPDRPHLVGLFKQFTYDAPDVR